MQNDAALPLLTDDDRDDHSARALVASGHGDMRALLAHLLSAGGFEVAKVRDGNEALERIGDNLMASPPRYFDLVVVDLRSRQKSGLNLFLRLRHGNWRPPVILVVPSNDAALRAETAQHGPFAVLEWPFAVEQLHAVARAARHSARRAQP
jgi:DNA-binding response OmpR family regulator